MPSTPAASGFDGCHTGMVPRSRTSARDAGWVFIVCSAALCAFMPPASSTARNFLYTCTVTHEHDGPLDRSVHRWSATSRTLETGLMAGPLGPGEWQITLHWRLIEGRPTPVGIDV